MRQFAYTRADSVQAAIHAQTATEMPANAATVHARSQYVAGGTTLIDLMKLDVMRPQAVTDINALAGTPSGEIKFGPRDSILAPWCACPRQPITQTSEKTTLSLRKRLSLPRVHKFAIWPRSAEMCCNGRAVRISAIPPTLPATNENRVRVVLPWMASTGCTRYWA